MEVSDGRLCISFCLKRQQVLIFRDVLRALGKPGCFRFLIDETTNRLAVQVCAFGDAGFHVTPDFEDKDSWWSYRICSQELLELIWDLCDWDSDGTYRVSGVLCPDIHAVMFELNDAEMYSGQETEMS